MELKLMKTSIIICLAFTVMGGCKKIIDIDIKNGSGELVIEGVITNSSYAEVHISQTVPFSSSNNFAGISSADVRITDDQGKVYILAETTKGVYENKQMLGLPGHTYQLNVLSGGKQFSATSTMPPVVSLDTVLLDQMSVFGTTTYIAKPRYKDPAGLGQCYRFIETINRNRYPIDWVWDDRVFDDGIKTIPLLQTDSVIHVKDTVQIEMQCVDKPVFRYFTSLTDMQNNMTTPVNPPGNISGGALGYFSAHTSQVKKYIVQ